MPMNLLGDTSDSVSVERPTESFFTDTESDTSGRGLIGQFLGKLSEKSRFSLRKEVRLAENTTAIVGADYALQNASMSPSMKIIHDVSKDGTLQFGWRKVKYSHRFGWNMLGRRFSVIPSASIRFDDDVISTSASLKIKNINLALVCGSLVYVTGSTIKKKIRVPLVPQTETTSGLDLVAKLGIRKGGTWPEISLTEPGFVVRLGPKTPPLLTDSFPKTLYQGLDNSKTCESTSDSDDAEERTR